MSARLFSRVGFLGLVLAGLLWPGPVGAADVVEYYHLDAVGNVRAVTDQARNVIERHDYLPFAEEWCPGPPPGVCGAVAPGQPKRFTGKERDAETGLDYFGARYFSAKIGRFTTVDPAYTWRENLVDPQRWNRYAYARNNPLRYVDPDGKAIDVVADIGFIGYDLVDIGRSVYRGEGVSGTQWLALGGDVVGAAIPFATGFGAAIRTGSKVEHAIEAGRAGEAIITANRAAGKAAEAKVAGELVAEGKTILGSQVCCRTSEGRRVIDHLTKDAADSVTAVEVKSGNATRSVAQRAKDAEIAAGRGTFVGKNARAAGVEGSQRAVETVERKPIQ
jgi:RHS repeat-associated protein